MSPTLLILVFLAVGAYIFQPMLQASLKGWGEPEADYDPLDLRQLRQRRSAALQALRDLESERELDKLSRADYDKLRGHYMREAAIWMRRLDEYEQVTG